MLAVAMLVGWGPAEPRSALAPALIAVSAGIIFCWLFRDDAGPLTVEWRRRRAASDPELFRFYAVSGPWLWRLGLAAALGVTVRLGLGA